MLVSMLTIILEVVRSFIIIISLHFQIFLYSNKVLLKTESIGTITGDYQDVYLSTKIHIREFEILAARWDITVVSIG